MLKVKLAPYKSPFYPIKATWRIKSIDYSAVFETIEEAKRYILARYNKASFRN